MNQFWFLCVFAWFLNVMVFDAIGNEPVLIEAYQHHSFSNNALMRKIRMQKQWASFKKTYGKSYANATEEYNRYLTFKKTLLKIKEHNHAYELGQESYQLDINKFADIDPKKFSEKRKGYFVQVDLSEKVQNEFVPDQNVKVPAAVDWREHGYVTDVKDQGECGSCWAFSSTGALKGQHFRKYKQLTNLSEQNLIDCSFDYGNKGCWGGLMNLSFTYVKNNHGIDTEESYPYVGLKTYDDHYCDFNASFVGATDSGFMEVQRANETALMIAVGTVGPISVAVDAEGDLQYYKSGIYYGKTCNPEWLTHAVLIVGYNTTKDGQDYWIIKNSWGSDWGENGYFRMVRNRGNNCGIASNAIFPIV